MDGDGTASLSPIWQRESNARTGIAAQTIAKKSVISGQLLTKGVPGVAGDRPVLQPTGFETAHLAWEFVVWACAESLPFSAVLSSFAGSPPAASHLTDLALNRPANGRLPVW